MKTIFNGFNGSGTEERDLSVDYEDDSIRIEIVDRTMPERYPFDRQIVSLDKSTAIKFVKRMKAEINRLARFEEYLESLVEGGNQDG